jgi:hypothetical protein
MDLKKEFQRDDLRFYPVPFEQVLKQALAKTGREKERQLDIMQHDPDWRADIDL